MDVYAAGLILYQAFNGGELPFTGDVAPAESFPAPLYADYEMAEIILKACSPIPEERWQDPMAMGQALVSYMQRNGANDTPIVPPTAPDVVVSDEDADVTEGEIEAPELDASAEEEITEEPEAVDEAPVMEVEEPVAEDEADTTEKSPYNEDDFGNLSFLDYVTAFDGDEDAEGIAYSEVSEEVTNMLEQADELIAHPTPNPVVAPEPIDVQIPAPIQSEPEEVAEENDDRQRGGGATGSAR